MIDCDNTYDWQLKDAEWIFDALWWWINRKLYLSTNLFKPLIMSLYRIIFLTENVHQRVCRRRPIVLDNQKGDRRANDEATGGWNKDDEK